MSKFSGYFKMKSINGLLLSACFLICVCYAKAQTISNTKISNTHFCLSGNYTVTFNTSGLGTTNTFTVQLSDNVGSFAATTTVGTSTDSTIIITIPTGSTLSNNYKIRIVRLASPTVIGDTLSSLTITKPAPSFTITNNNTCAGTNVSFTNTSTGVGTLAYSWNFSATAGAPSSPNTNATPTVQFNPAVGGGTVNYLITLTVTDGYGCVNSTNSVDSVKQKPDAILTDSNFLNIPTFSNCNGSPSVSSPTFRLGVVNSSINQTLISNYTLNWGIGSTITLPNTFSQIGHLYTSLGVYNLQFVAVNTNGCIDTSNYIIANQSNPAIGYSSPGIGGFGSTSGCTPLTLPFILNSYQNNAPGTYYVFDFEDGTPLIRWDTVTNDTIWHTFINTTCPSGGYHPKVKAYNYCTSDSAIAGTVKIYNKPKANFNLTDSIFCLSGNVINITNTSTLGYYGLSCSRLTSFYWSFLNGTPSSASSLNTILVPNPPSVTYSSSGLYSLQLVATNKLSTTFGCGSDTITKTICIQPTPIPNFTLSQTSSNGCVNDTVSLTNISNTLTSCGNTTYSWIIIDNLTSTTLAPGARYYFVSPFTANTIDSKINFTQSGIYKIRLQVSNSCGSFIKDTIITIKSKPTVILQTAKTYCDNQTISFSSSNSNHNPTIIANNGTISAYNWTITPSGYTFSVGNANSANPTISFPNTGTNPITYTVTLTVTNECGTSISSSQTITINPKPSISNAGLTQVLCGSTTTNMTANTPIVGSGTWALISGPTGSTISQTNNPNTNITGLNSTGNPSIYVYRWTISQVGCSSSVSNVTINVYPATNPGVIGSVSPVCSGANGILTLTGNAGNVVKWQSLIAPFSPLSWIDISNTTTTQSYTNLTQTTWYRAVVQSGGVCSTANSPAVIITVDSMTVAGNLTGTDTVCTGTNSGILTLNNRRGSIVNWQFSTTLPAWNNIGTTTVNPYTFSNLTQTTWFRVRVKNGVCPYINSDSVRIQVDALPSAAVAPNKQICATSLTLGTDDNLVANPISIGTGLWSYISGPNTPIIASPNNTTSAINNMAIGIHLIQWKVINGKCPDNTATLQFKIESPLVSTIAANQTICSGQIPSLITGTTPTGGNGTYAFQWQQSLNGTTWTIIPSATNTNYQPNALTTTTYYRKVVTSGNCIVPSNSILITIVPIIVNAISNSTPICFGATAPLIGNSVATGGNGTYSYQWQDSSNGSSWTNISGAILSNYSPGILTSTKFYRRLVNSGLCTSTSNSVLITINLLPNVNAGGPISKCQNQSTFNLIGTPSGGSWSGTGVVSNTFNPSAMPLGSYTLVYTYTD
jgi:hypothetical protein